MYDCSQEIPEQVRPVCTGAQLKGHLQGGRDWLEQGVQDALVMSVLCLDMTLVTCMYSVVKAHHTVPLRQVHSITSRT